MPSTSKAQHNFMEAVAHNKAFAKKVGVPSSVGEEFSKADKGRKFRKGGDMKESMKDDIKQDKAIVKKAFKMHDAQEHKGEHTNLSKLKKGGVPMKKMAVGGLAGKPTSKGKLFPEGKTMGSMNMKKGGVAEVMGPRTMGKDVEAGSNKLKKFGESAVEKRGHTKGKNLGDSGPTAKIQTMKKMAAGGLATRGYGIARKCK
jgi:hypothetical protein